MKHFLILFLFPFFAFAQQKEQSFELYGEGIKAYYEGSYEKAIGYFDQAIKLKSDFKFAYLNRSLCNQKMNQHSLAISDLSEVIQLDSNYIDAYSKRADSYIKIAEYEEAIGDLQHLIRTNPEVKFPFKNLGLCYYYIRQYALANASFSQYLNVYPNDVEAWFQKGLSNFYYADYETSVTDFSKVVELDKDYLSAYDWRAQSYQKANYLKKACQDWKMALELGYENSRTNFEKYCGE